MTCTACSTANPPGARFCAACGASLAPAQVVDGERKIATVLFADVVGSTSLAEALDPEAWAEIMNGVFAFMNEAVVRFGGVVSRLMGDGILAIFGAHVTHEDDAERAVHAALEIRRAARRYGRGMQESHGLPFDVRVGVNSGLVVLTTVGDSTKTEYTAMGDAPNVAARLQSLAEPNAVLIGADTHALVRHAFDVEGRGEVPVRGRAEPVLAFEVLRAKASPGRGRGIDDMHGPLVGRTDECDRLRMVFDRLGDHRGGLVALVGEAGVGKSRLMMELAVRAGDVGWLEGRALSYTAGVQYYPWRRVMRASLGASDEDPPEAVRAALAQALEVPGTEEDDLPLLATLSATESEGDRRALDELGANLLPRIQAAAQRYVRRVASTHPTVIVLDDLHWADVATTHLVAAIADLVREVPLVLVLVLRPEKTAPIWTTLERLRSTAPDVLHEIELAPLPADQAGRLLDGLVDFGRLTPRLRTMILERADGNPFYLEEIVRALEDYGVLSPSPDGRVAEAPTELPIPGTLVGVLSSRIDRLPSGAKRVLQTAAVIGRSFRPEVLASVLAKEGTAEPVAADIEVLVREGLVQRIGPDGSPEYVFRHALTQEAAYERLLLKRRRELHLRVGEALEQHTDTVRPDDAVLAHHFLRAEAWMPGAKYAVPAAERALWLYALEEAKRGIDAALHAIERTPDVPQSLEIDAIATAVDVAVALRLHERPDQRSAMLAQVERGIDLARTIDDPRRLTRALVAKGNVLSLSGLPYTSFDALVEAHDLARDLHDDKLYLLPYWAATEMLVGDDPRAAVEQFTSVIALARHAGNKGIEAHALATKAVAHARLGNFEEARVTIEEAIAIAPVTNSHIKEADVYISAGAVYLDLGEPELSLAYSRRGADMAIQVHGFECACSGMAIAGNGELESNRFDAAEQDFDRSIELGTGTRMEGVFLHQARGGRALARLRSGDTHDMQELESALAHGRRATDTFGIATILLALGHAHIEFGQPSDADAHLHEALTLFRDRGMQPYVARTLEAVASMREAQGRHGEAETARDEAERIMQEIPQQEGDVRAEAVRGQEPREQ